jgi:hypothetical protein
MLAEPFGTFSPKAAQTLMSKFVFVHWKLGRSTLSLTF